MKQYFDINEKQLKIGDIIDLHQTVNGENLFVIHELEPLDLRYLYSANRQYEYDQEEMLAPSRFTGEVEWEIVDTVI